ncbi:cytochrome c oxidase assembly protein subunit 15 [Arsukibacterium tuosuense]|uniref:Cytochrome c oxidase assembly protein subunit 15 n=1 Tax=Arsukibacterium tuosuense TaxID=1323745 RepID=A0A285JGN2_9GAMM|nr:COX15/CtaA family protein [Arsukibacterium tuosuense]SNY59438.1 cytochrome c oxidase assembly protein subunit 15 [Arsukibacterium tuosuense]
MTRHKWLVSFTLILTMVVIIYGAFTRLTDAGLGCPDWPGCYGFLKVPEKPESVAIAAQAFPERPLEPQKAWNEMIHRYLAGTLGLLIAALFISSMISKARQPRTLPAVLLLLVICQAALGAWTVTMSLLPIVVLAHLLGGFTLYCLLALYWMQLTPTLRVVEPALEKLKPLAVGAAIVVMVQIGLGGWTAANYAALACIELPVCEAGWVSRLALDEAFDLHLGYSDYEYGVMSAEARQTVHVFHRLGAYITLGVVSWFAVSLYRHAQTSIMRKFALATGVILLLQFILGLLNVVLHLPLVNAVAHNFVGANLLMIMVVVVYQLYRPVGREA